MGLKCWQRTIPVCTACWNDNFIISCKGCKSVLAIDESWRSADRVYIRITNFTDSYDYRNLINEAKEKYYRRDNVRQD